MLINTTDVVDGALVSAIAATGRTLAGSASSLRSRRSAADLDIARWFDHLPPRRGRSSGPMLKDWAEGKVNFTAPA